jgi:hypothetical protein
LDLPEALEITLEKRVGLNAILEAAKLEIEFRRAAGGEAIDDPLAGALAYDHVAVAQVGEMLGNGDLVEMEDLLEMTDTEWAVREEMENAQASFVTETFINLDQTHT